MSNQPPAVTQRSLTGLVTKLVGGPDGATYGFINDEIFFPQANVSGGPASVGDQVFADCEYSAHLPIKWNAKSIQILSKGGGGGGQPRPDQQDLMNQQSAQQQQQQQQFNQANPVAVTYQQHRQQRQQRQVMDVDKQPDNMNVNKHQGSDLTSKLLEQTNQSGDFYGNAARPFNQQQPQQQDNIQPFQQDQPMGPPNFTYTSQLGSAFVQNQFVPSPFITQQQAPMLPQHQPPPMLPQHQQPQQQQQLLPNNNTNQVMHNNQNNNNQRHNQHNKGNMGGGGRFNNQGEKNDRQNNRNRNRNDNKFDRPKSGERDNGQQNNRSKSRGSRERSIGRNPKREDPPARPSPPAHSSSRSNASVSSDRGNKSRRHYEVQNIPKTQIMTNMNAYNMKQRCPSSVHVPSDLKEIIVNRHFRLDIKNTPKPLTFTIEESKSTEVAKKEDAGGEQQKDESKNVSDEVTKTDAAAEAPQETTDVDQTDLKSATNEENPTNVERKKSEVGSIDHLTPPSSKSDPKLRHKYGVKVILLSLPELATIYRRVFGANLDSYNADAKPNTRLDEAISLLCNKGSNNGYSLIGGKFDSVLDGFVEGQVNEYERHGLLPDLIATCKRVVAEQTGLDLAKCKSWTLLSTFMYNNRTDYYSSKASVEYSFIYMPQIWTMLSDKFDKYIIKPETLEIKHEEETAEQQPIDAQTTSDPSDQEATNAQEMSDAPKTIEADQEMTDNGDSEIQAPVVAPVAEDVVVSVPENLAELKVTDLKNELDKRNIKYKAGAKKAELVALLQEYLSPSTLPPEPTDVVPNVEVQLDDVKPLIQSKIGEIEDEEEEANISTVATIGDESQLEEGEVEADPSEDSPTVGGDEVPEVSESANKRKASDDITAAASEPDVKKVCKEQPVAQKDQKVELIQESFSVCARGDQQLSLVSLHDATLAARYDQFELSVASNILKESLVQHLSEYILTTLVEDHLQRNASTTSGGGNTSSGSSSQEMSSSDTNNNNSNNSKSTTFKNPSSVSDQKQVNLKEFPIDRYINLAFSYFDASHMGYIYTDDLNKLFNNTGLTISKRALNSLAGDSEKFNYKTLPDLSPKLSPTYVYRFPEQFKSLPGCSFAKAEAEDSCTKTLGNMIEFKGVTYDLESLIQQVNDAETLRVSLVDRFNYAIENSDKQTEEIHVLEVSQKSLAKAIKAQNDEICDLKRERDAIKKKYESVRKGIKGSISSLTELVKDDK